MNAIKILILLVFIFLFVCLLILLVKGASRRGEEDVNIDDMATFVPMTPTITPPKW